MVCAAECDPLVAIVRHANPSDIDTVLVGGKVVKEGGKLRDVDVRELRGWHGTELINRGSLSWAQVAQHLRRSRVDVQERIEKCNIDLAKEKVLEMWGNKDGEDVLQ